MKTGCICRSNVKSQGSQPLISEITNLWADIIVEIFNSERNLQLDAYAVEGVKLYFVGFLFAGYNIVGAGYLSAAESAGWAFVTSILRGFVAIVICAFVFAMLWGMTGVWLAFAAAELITAVAMVVAIWKSRIEGRGKYL